MEDPVWVDLVSGNVWALPADAAKEDGGALAVRGVPYSDGAAALVPRALLRIEKPKEYKRKAAPNMKDGKKTKVK